MNPGFARRALWAVAALVAVTLTVTHVLHLTPLAAATPFSQLAAVEPGSPAAVASAARGLDLSQLDPTCEPCKDFAQFADGGWLKANPIPARYPLWGRVFALRDTNTARIHALLDAAAADPAAGDARTHQVGEYYAACMDTATIDSLGTTPIAGELARAAAVTDGASLAVELAHLHDIGITPLFYLTAEANPAGAARPEILAAGQAGLSMPDKSYYLDPAKEALRTAFVDHVAKMFVLVGDDQATSATEAQTVLAFEKSVAAFMKAPAELRDPVANTNVMPMAKAAALFGTFDFNGYLAARHLPATGTIDVGQPAYATALGSLLAATPPATLVTILRWDVVNAAAATLAAPIDAENFHFYGTVLSGTPEQRPRWQRCVDGVTRVLGDSVGEVYDAKYFTAKQRARAMAMILNVKAMLRSDMATLPWMSPNTRKVALQKLDLMGIRVGYPDHPMDYSGIAIHRDTYAANYLNAAAAGVKRDLDELGKPFDRTRWALPSPTVNAFYRTDANDITFFAGILQAPFFSDTFDDATNYGAMGVIMGHEMTHGFDDSGRHIDGYGALKDWWTPKDATAFNARAACVQDQFDQFVVADGVHANGALELGEAIADLGGATIAYKAFQRINAGKPQTKIDGFTPDQRFFLGFATFQTEEDRPAYAKQRASSEPHPLGPFRIDGTLANMPAFAAAFSCPAVSAMVRPPSKQCKIW
jgi:predicted metalloendopeptidase